jgi:hypothetical protein
VIRANAHSFGPIRTLVIVRLLAIGLVASTAVPAMAAAPGFWTTTGNLNTARIGHTATLLLDGRVLVAGGGDGKSENRLISAELYNPVTGTWTVTGNMTTPRESHTATLLPNGQVLVAGGIVNISTNPGGGITVTFTATTELYNPATGNWTTTSSMTTPRSGQGATRLQNGQVLVAGGIQNFGGTTSYSPVALASAELYDPFKGAWSATGSMNATRAGVQATLLENGQVLMAQVSAELYDPSTGRWTFTAPMPSPGPGGSAALLTNGAVVSYGYHLPSYASQLYDPFTNTWTLNFGQSYGGISAGPLTLLGTGKLLLAGGKPKYGSVTGACMLFDPSTNHWVLTGNLSPRAGHTLTRLQNGQVLAAGGTGLSGLLASAQLYTP